MDVFIVLSGGYWGLSAKPDMGGIAVNRKDAENKATVDYIIKVNNIPNNFFSPVEVIREFRYYCELCKRWVSESEIENKRGCFTNHERHLRTEYRDVKGYDAYEFTEYKIDRYKWIKPCYRINLGVEKGINKWREIWRYIEMMYPPNEKPRLKPDLMPVAVGGRREWTVTEEEVPVIKLPKSENDEQTPEITSEWKVMIAPKIDERKDRKAEELMPCDICGKEFGGAKALRMHKWSAHKMKTPKKE